MPPAAPKRTKTVARALVFVPVRSVLCLFAVGIALVLSACGDGDATAEDTQPGTRPDTTAPRRTGAARPTACPAQVATLVDDLDRLRRQLAVGLSYDQYAARVKQLRASYAAVPIDRLALSCLHATGAPAEDALNKYVDGANAWGQCLADAACTTAAIEPVLQRKWRAASHFLAH